MTDEIDPNDFTTDGVKRLITANNDMLDEWNAERGITTERMDMKAELAALRSEVERLTKERDEYRAADFYRAEALKLAESEATRLRGELARVRAETVEECAKVAESLPGQRGNSPEHLVGIRVAAAIRALEPRHD